MFSRTLDEGSQFISKQHGMAAAASYFRDAKSWINFGWSRVLTENAFDKSIKVQTVSSTMSIIFISAKNLI